MTDELPSEYIVLNKTDWKEIFLKQGAGKGQNPVVLSSGYVYVGKEYTGKEARVFVKEMPDVIMNLDVKYVLAYAKFLFKDYGVSINKWQMTVGGDRYRGHVSLDVGGKVERIPKEVIEHLNDFASKFGRVADNWVGYTIEFKDLSRD